MAGIGIVFYLAGVKVATFSAIVEAKTNNEAEYLAVLQALTLVRQLKYEVDIIDVYSDSKLVINQLKGNWKINKGELKSLYDSIMFISMLCKDENFKYLNLHWVSRDDNQEANDLAQNITEAS